MGQALTALGINLPSLIAFFVNFGLLLLLLRLTLYKPVLRTLDERRQRIQASLTAADTAAEQAREAEQRVQEQIRQAQLQGQEIVVNANQVAQRVEDEARRTAEQRAEQIVARAEAAFRQEMEAARAALRREFADLTILAAERVINQSLDRSAHQRLIDEVLAEAGDGRRG